MRFLHLPGTPFSMQYQRLPSMSGCNAPIVHAPAVGAPEATGTSWTEGPPVDLAITPALVVTVLTEFPYTPEPVVLDPYARPTTPWLVGGAELKLPCDDMPSTPARTMASTLVATFRPKRAAPYVEIPASVTAFESTITPSPPLLRNVVSAVAVSALLDAPMIKGPPVAAAAGVAFPATATATAPTAAAPASLSTPRRDDPAAVSSAAMTSGTSGEADSAGAASDTAAGASRSTSAVSSATRCSSCRIRASSTDGPSVAAHGDANRRSP